MAYHSVNVAILGATLANHIGLPVSQVREVAFGGLVHDIGTVLVNPGILSKKTEFTPEEYKEMTKHPILGYQLIKRQADVPEAVALCALEHHERFDGSGYPKGLPFEKISPHARLLGIVDTFDAMTNERPHKRGIMPRDALKIMYMERDKLFYSEHLEQFIKCMGIYPVGSFVKLSDGKYGIVMNNFPDSPLTPEVKVILDRKFLPISNFLVKVSQPSDNRENICITECLDPDVLKIDLAKYLN